MFGKYKYNRYKGYAHNCIYRQYSFTLNFTAYVISPSLFHELPIFLPP